MAVIVPPTTYFDFRKALTKSKLISFWRMMPDYRLAYAAANLSLGISAIAKMATYLLLRNFADTILGTTQPFAGTLSRTLAMIAVGFIILALFEG